MDRAARNCGTVNYSFEPATPPFEDEPQIFVDPMNPQSDLSSALCDLPSRSSSPSDGQTMSRRRPRLDASLEQLRSGRGAFLPDASKKRVAKLLAVRVEMNGGTLREVPESELELPCDSRSSRWASCIPEHKGTVDELGLALDARGNIVTDRSRATLRHPPPAAAQPAISSCARYAVEVSAAERRVRRQEWTSKVFRGPNALRELEHDGLAEWRALGPSDRLALSWELSLEQYGGDNGTAVEPRLPRSAYRVERR